MIPIVSFIGWHNSGKTTFTKEVVKHLKKHGFRVAVIKSTKHTAINFDQEATDTDLYKKSGADCVTLMAPDQMIIMADNPQISLAGIVHNYFSDYDIVIGEGFKHEPHIAKIEINREKNDLLRDQVRGVIALVTDQELSGETLFRHDETKEVTDFIIQRFIGDKKRRKELATLFVNGTKVPLKEFVQDALAGTVSGFVQTLKQAENIQEIDLKITLKGPEPK